MMPPEAGACLGLSLMGIALHLRETNPHADVDALKDMALDMVTEYGPDEAGDYEALCEAIEDLFDRQPGEESVFAHAARQLGAELDENGEAIIISKAEAANEF